jgi:hypothetical protein
VLLCCIAIKVIVWCSVAFHFEFEASTDIRPLFHGHISLAEIQRSFAHDMHHFFLLICRHPIVDQLWLGHVGSSIILRSPPFSPSFFILERSPLQHVAHRLYFWPLFIYNCLFVCLFVCDIHRVKRRGVSVASTLFPKGGVRKRKIQSSRHFISSRKPALCVLDHSFL